MPLNVPMESDSADSLNTKQLNSKRQELANLEKDLITVQDILAKDLEMPLVGLKILMLASSN